MRDFEVTNQEMRSVSNPLFATNEMIIRESVQSEYEVTNQELISVRGIDEMIIYRMSHLSAK